MLRPLGIVAGPAAVVALGLLVVGVVVEGEAGVVTSRWPLASFGLLLVALLGIGASAVAALARMRDAGRAVPGVAIAVVGTVLVAGGGWAALFVLGAGRGGAGGPGRGLQSVVVGYIASYLVFAVGWVWTGISPAPRAPGADLARCPPRRRRRGWRRAGAGGVPAPC